jgi:hypothetical protein
MCECVRRRRREGEKEKVRENDSKKEFMQFFFH